MDQGMVVTVLIYWLYLEVMVQVALQGVRGIMKVTPILETMAQGDLADL
jgi:hypothetical protein